MFIFLASYKVNFLMMSQHYRIAIHTVVTDVTVITLAAQTRVAPRHCCVVRVPTVILVQPGTKITGERAHIRTHARTHDVCVRACMLACAQICVCVCARARARARACVCVCVCVFKVKAALSVKGYLSDVSTVSFSTCIPSLRCTSMLLGVKQPTNSNSTWMQFQTDVILDKLANILLPHLFCP